MKQELPILNLDDSNHKKTIKHNSLPSILSIKLPPWRLQKRNITPMGVSATVSGSQSRFSSPLTQNFSSPKHQNIKNLSTLLPDFKTTSKSLEERDELKEKEAKMVLDELVNCLTSALEENAVLNDDEPFEFSEEDHISDYSGGNNFFPSDHDSEVSSSPTKSSISSTVSSSIRKLSLFSTASTGSPFSPSVQPQFAYYKIEKSIGEGSYGKVKLATHILTGEKVAIKCLSKSKMESVQGASERILREIYLLCNLEHPYICPLLQVENSIHNIYLVMDYSSNGDLLNYITEKGYAPGRGLEENVVQEMFFKILSAVKFCHDHDIVHRDLKPDNKPQLIDFGFANIVRKNQLLETSCGSLAYIAPEIILKKPYHGKPVDAWSLGILLYTMVTGSLPFDEPTPPKTVTKIITGKYTIPDYVSEECQQVIKGLLKVSVKERLSLDDVCQLPWIKNSKDYNLVIAQDNGLLRANGNSHENAINNTIIDLSNRCNKNDTFTNNCTSNNVHNIEDKYFAMLTDNTLVLLPPQLNLNEKVVEQMAEFGMKRDEIVEALSLSRPGFIAATYKLLLKKHRHMKTFKK